MMNTSCRYDMSSNHWEYESRVPPKKAPLGSAFGIVVVSGEVYVLSHLYDDDFAETRRSRPYKKTGTMCFQIYNPKKKTWRTLVTKSPFTRHIDITSAVLSSIRLWIIVHLIFMYSLGICQHNIIWPLGSMQVAYICIFMCLVHHLTWSSGYSL